MTSFERALQAYQLASSLLAEVLSACEVIDSESLQPVQSLLGLTNPLPGHPFYLLLECSGSRADHDEDKLERFLERAINDGIISNGLVTAEPSKVKVSGALK